MSAHLRDNTLPVCLTLSPPFSGVISSKINTLDRETKSQYVVVVKAQDLRGLTSGSTATTSVSITITDTNDNIASFIQSRERAPKSPFNEEPEALLAFTVSFLCRVL